MRIEEKKLCGTQPDVHPEKKKILNKGKINRLSASVHPARDIKKN